MDKAGLRRELAGRRDAVPAPEREAASRAAAERVVAIPEWASAAVVGLYVPIRSEVPTQPLLAHARADGKTVAVPRVDGDRLVWQAVESFEGLAPGAFGVPEPARGDRVSPVLIVVPGLAFDPDGGRLGYGRGYFDRALAEFRGVSVGLAYDFQVLARLPQDAHDVPVRLVATDARLLRAAEKRA